MCHQLKEMVLHHVANSSGLIVKGAASLHTEILCHCDLDALDMLAIPHRFERCVGEAEKKHVVHGLLSQVMVDAEDAALIERAQQNPVQSLRRGEVRAKRLLDDDPCTFVAT